MNGITNIFGSLLTYGIGHIDSPHLKPYQVCGLFARKPIVTSDKDADYFFVLWTDHGRLLGPGLAIPA